MRMLIYLSKEGGVMDPRLMRIDPDFIINTSKHVERLQAVCDAAQAVVENTTTASPYCLIARDKLFNLKKALEEVKAWAQSGNPEAS